MAARRLPKSLTLESRLSMGGSWRKTISILSIYGGELLAVVSVATEQKTTNKSYDSVGWIPTCACGCTRTIDHY